MSDTRHDGQITDDGIARLRARIGVAEPHPMPPHYSLPTTDTFEHVAEAYGDDNPLWCDRDYAETTRWQGPIAPPVLVGGDTLIGDDEVTALDPDTRALLKGDPLRGVHAFYAASARANGGHRSDRCGRSPGATRWWPCSTSRVSSPSGQCTSGPVRCSEKSTVRFSPASTGS